MAGLAAETANLIVALKLDDSGFSGKLNAAARQLRSMDAGLSQVGRGVGQVGSGLVRLGERAAIAAVGGLGAVVTTAASFEDAFAGVEKTVDATDAQLADLESTFRQMARTIPVSFEELSAIGEQAGALGIAIDAIDEFTEVAATLGVTTDVSSDQAATSLGVLSNVLKLTADDYERFADVLVQLGNDGASTESAILGIAERAGAGAGLIGIAADETLAWSSAVANLGIETEAGGSALQKFFVETLRNLQDDDTLAVMAETAGMTGDAFVQAFDKDASGALRTFVGGLGELAEAERLAVLEALGFNDIRITRTLLGLAGNVDEVERAFGNLEKAEGAAQREAEKRFKTTAAQWQVFKNNIRDTAATIGTELLPVVNETLGGMVNTLNQPETQAAIRAFAVDLAQGVKGFAAELRGTDWSGILGFARGAAEAAKVAFNLFTSMPKEIQQLALAAYGVNRLSGGALGSIAKGLGNIFLGSLKTITAGNVTVVGKSVTGTGGGGGGMGLLGTAGLAALGLGALTVGATEVSKTVNPTSFNFNQLAGQSKGATRVKVEGDLLNLSAQTGRSVDQLRASMIPLLQSGTRSWQQVVDETRRLTMSQTRVETATRGSLATDRQALAMQAQALAAARGTTAEVSRLANTPHNVNVDNNITIPVHVSATLIQNQLYRLRTTTGSGGFI